MKRASRPSAAAPILAALAILLVTLGAYVGGYFWLGGLSVVYFDQIIDDCRVREGRQLERAYGAHWQAVAFWPAAQLESWLRGVRVSVKPWEE